VSGEDYLKHAFRYVIKVYTCPQLSEVYLLRKPTTIRVTRLLQLYFHNYR